MLAMKQIIYSGAHPTQNLRIPNPSKYEQKQHRDGESSAGGVAKHRG